jgi:hypothetical protein
MILFFIRYNTLSTNSGWISASTRGYGSSYGRSGSRHGNTLGREDVELIDSSKTVSSPARYSSGRGSSSGAKTYGYTEPSQTPGGGYAAALRPWYARRLEGKQAEDTEEETTRNPQENMIPRTLQPVILLAAYGM